MCLASTDAEFQSIQQLQQTAEKFIRAAHQPVDELHIKFGYIDKRLRLPHCDEPLQGYFPDQRLTLGSTLVGVQCAGLRSWKVVIPVVIRAYGPVVITNEPLSKDTLLSSANLRVVRQELTDNFGGSFSKPEAIEGMVLKQSITKDTVLSPLLVKPKRLVLRGEAITILAEYQALVIHAQGIALMDGHRGDLIRVQNSRSGRELQAEVIDSALVRVKM
ncbi:MAG: flagellar basal body P-ring formation protein FlgA [Gammaproteobacteria bacterium]|nr:flagellar basal body P-ring formation protein FlgA [Gammaproteobacteria bacterium]